MMGALAALVLLTWCVLPIVGVILSIRYWRASSHKQNSKRGLIRLLAFFLGAYCLSRSLYELGSTLFTLVKVFASVASVPAQDKSTLLSAGIASVMNDMSYALMTTLPIAILAWLLLKLLSEKNPEKMI